ncbi:unnamed protein product [Rotaria socialis]|uniref:SWIM-type domain-containing protein n=1 Tax=Rotaria socialis TaxID=392032 RepID=A0A818W577_9BILA|nr:unnamed protein product [Rotaria socialis]CAF4886003.1 unnamed protein product [Rotaria socialis]
MDVPITYFVCSYQLDRSKQFQYQKLSVATVQFNNEDQDESVNGWFCTCAAGARAIGCCSHITALIWHLGVCRGEVQSTEHQLSASIYLQSIQDYVQYSDIDSTDEEPYNSTTNLSGDD